MKVHINGEALILQSNDISKKSKANLTDVLAQYLTSRQQKMSFAVALNSDFVSKSQYSSTLLNDGDSIDVLFPIVGG
ncbi:sulfur carrier protein ThiS [Colwellia sp. 1_MG-2023]|uniref:sulfur carrier protein ThiS n=1 Tax=Colwellia sp. 1_MG-2023 TaxID=3062649 RepID=UPI0026E37376|nr:sulfur carrier protein ThiS [Colwellia sp. 1_MG-2023]MDO6445530.1 sulfur carrier protein ThiS [Colwellia sp. 1_MG-2023]